MPVKAPKVAVVATPSPWDIAFGAAIMSDYVWRGVTQSGHKPSVAAYFEPRYNINSNLQAYVGISAARASSSPTTRLPKSTSTAASVRPSARSPSISAFGTTTIRAAPATSATPACPSAIPNGNVAKADASFYEVYGKVTYTIGDFALGANEYYSPNFLNTGAWGNYASGTFKYTAPDEARDRSARLVRLG